MPAPGPALARGLADMPTSRLPERNSPQQPPPPSMPPREDASAPTSPENEIALSQLQMIEYGLNPLDPLVEGHKYGLPELPLPPHKNAKYRYDDIVTQVTKLLMKDGKLAKAQRVRSWLPVCRSRRAVLTGVGV